VALDVEPEDRLRGLLRLVGGLGDLDAARLSTAARLHLGLDHDDAAELFGGLAHVLGGVRDDAGEHRHSVLLEEVSGLVLVKIHALLPIGPRVIAQGWWDERPGRMLSRRREFSRYRDSGPTTMVLPRRGASEPGCPGSRTCARAGATAGEHVRRRHPTTATASGCRGERR